MFTKIMEMEITDKNELLALDPITGEVNQRKLNPEEANLCREIFKSEISVNLFAKEITDEQIGTLTIKKYQSSADD